MHNDQMCNSDGGLQEIEEVLLFLWAKTSWDEEGGRSYMEIPAIGQQMALEQWQHVYLKLVEEYLMKNN